MIFCVPRFTLPSKNWETHRVDSSWTPCLHTMQGFNAHEKHDWCFHFWHWCFEDTLFKLMEKPKGRTQVKALKWSSRNARGILRRRRQAELPKKVNGVFYEQWLSFWRMDTTKDPNRQFCSLHLFDSTLQKYLEHIDFQSLLSWRTFQPSHVADNVPSVGLSHTKCRDIHIHSVRSSNVLPWRSEKRPMFVSTTGF